MIFLSHKINKSIFSLLSMVINNKKGQFFILAAIIIVSVVVGLMVVKNYVTVGQAPNQVSQYSEEFGTESGAVVDYVLYNGKSGVYLGSFYNESISNILTTKYPDLEVYACYGNKTILNCENWGKEDINVSVNDSIYSLQGGRKLVNNGLCVDISCQIQYVELRTQNPSATKTSFSSAGVDNITIITLTNNYSIDLSRAVQSNQFYLLFKQNSTGGSYASIAPQ